jgi:hypothetical protein
MRLLKLDAINENVNISRKLDRISCYPFICLSLLNVKLFFMNICTGLLIYMEGIWISQNLESEVFSANSCEVYNFILNFKNSRLSSNEQEVVLDAYIQSNRDDILFSITEKKFCLQFPSNFISQIQYEIHVEWLFRWINQINRLINILLQSF